MVPGSTPGRGPAGPEAAMAQPRCTRAGEARAAGVHGWRRRVRPGVGGLGRWVVVGASWGVTLALAYAQAHPERVTAMVLAAVTSGTRRETDWITRDMRRVFPREGDTFAAVVPEPDRHGDLSAAYARLLADPNTSDRAAEQWCAWEDTHVSLMPDWQPSPRYQDPAFRQVFARLVTHYRSNGCFLADDQIAANMHRIATIPAPHPRPLRRLRAPGHRLGPASGLAVQSPGRPRQQRPRGCRHDRRHGRRVGRVPNPPLRSVAACRRGWSGASGSDHECDANSGSAPRRSEAVPNSPVGA
jgi:proline iminopeptidase